MTTIDLHDAIRAAMQDQFDRTGSTHVDRVEPVVRAALPHIEAAIREQVAAEIATSVPYNCELRPDGTEDHDSAIYVGALHDAWRIAKGDGNE